MLKSSLFCLGHVILITNEVLALHVRLVATNHWLDGLIAAHCLLIVLNAIMFCLWAARGVSAWQHRRAERLLDRQVRGAPKKASAKCAFTRASLATMVQHT